MIENNISQQEKVLLVGVITQANDESVVSEHLDELALLVETAGGEVIGEVTQKISRINPATLVGIGKAKQIISQAKELGAKLIIFDDELTPSQQGNIEKIIIGAHSQNWTDDPVLTMDVLYQLSYVGFFVTVELIFNNFNIINISVVKKLASLNQIFILIS